MSEPQTPYDRLGVAEVDRIVEDFYERVIADAELSPFFEHTDLTRLLSMQREYVATALGGPGVWSAGRLRDAHSGRGIRGRHFVRFLEVFLETLEESELEADEIDVIIDRMAIASTDVLDSPADSG